MEPDCNILPLLGGHFTKRLGDQDWIIHDLGRGTALLYRDGVLEMAEITLDAVPDDKESGKQEDEYFHLWRAYYRSIGIAERKNSRLRMSFMPKKYWKHLPEMAPDSAAPGRNGF